MVTCSISLSSNKNTNDPPSLALLSCGMLAGTRMQAKWLWGAAVVVLVGVVVHLPSSTAYVTSFPDEPDIDGISEYNINDKTITKGGCVRHRN